MSDKTLGRDKVREFIKGLYIARKSVDSGLLYGSLYRASVEIRAYADASFATNEDLSLQLGYIIQMSDATGTAHVLYSSSRKSRRVARSIMAAEVSAFVDALDGRRVYDRARYGEDDILPDPRIYVYGLEAAV